MLNLLSQTITKYINASPKDIEKLLQDEPEVIHTNPYYYDLLKDIDLNKLSRSMVSARQYMDKHLPTLVAHYQSKHNLTDFPLTGFMVCNWVVAYVKTPSSLPNLLNTHANVSRAVMVDTLPELLELLGNVPEASDEWQRAFATVVIPLVAMYVEA